MSINDEDRKGLHCKRCGYSWYSRKAIVKICARCKSPYWDIDKIDHTMYKLTDAQIAKLDMVSKQKGVSSSELLDKFITWLEMESLEDINIMAPRKNSI